MVAVKNSVKILARVIADGVRDMQGNPPSSRYRLSLALLPDLRTQNNGRKINLDDWPIVLASSKFKLYAAIDPDAPNPGPSGASSTIVEIKEWFLRGATQPGPQGTNAQAYEFDHNRAKKADKLWKKVFLTDCGKYEQFSALYETLSPTAPEIFELNANDDPQFVTYPVARLARGVAQMYGAHFAASTLAAAGQLAMYDESAKAPWDASRAIVSPKFFEGLNSDLFGVYQPDTMTNRLAASTDPLGGDNGNTNKALVTYIKEQLEQDGARKSGPVANCISYNFTQPLRAYLNSEAVDNKRLKRRWTAFHKFEDPAPADLTRANIDDSIDTYFEAMASYLAPWCRGELPGSGARGPSFLSGERASLASVKGELRQSVAGYHAAWRPYGDQIARLKDNDCGKLTDIARKKFLSILARPGLAKFLGFIIDIEVSAAEFKRIFDKLGIGSTPNSYFYLMADFGADDDGNNGAIDNPGARVWTTAIVERDQTGGKVRFFGPANKKSFGDAKRIGLTAAGISALATDPYDRGVLDLAAPGEDTKPRYAIVDFDIDAALQSLENSSLDRTTALQKGAVDGSVSSALPNLQTRGLALIDRDRKSELAKESQGTNAVMAMAETKAQVLYAEDLVIGYRLDIGICKANGKELPEEKRWRSLHNRTVRYDANDIGGAYMQWVSADWMREDGFAKPVTRQADTNANGGPQQFIAQETLAVWTGTSLAVRTERGPSTDDGDDAFADWIDPYCELGTNLTYSLPTEAHRRLPPLRFFRGYWIGARLVYANGGSLSLEDAVRKHYVATTTTAVGGDGQGFEFKRGERLPAPEILLPPDDLLIAQPLQTHGEGLSTAVVRGDSPVRRYLVPRNVNFEMAEAHGEFDKQSPRSAFTTYARSPGNGSFPPARKQKPQVVDLDEKSKTDKRSSPGNVLKPGNSHTAAPYFPDPMARECRILPLLHGCEENPKTDRKVHLVSFYSEKGATIDKARPIVIEVSAFDPKPNEDQYTIKTVEHNDKTHVHVRLAKAQDLDLVVWTEPEHDVQLLGMRALASGWSYIPRVLARYGMAFDALKNSPAPKIQALASLLSSLGAIKAGEAPAAKSGDVKILNLLRQIHDAPHRTISDHKRVRVVRPVMAPLAAPYIEPAKFRAVRIEIKQPEKLGAPGAITKQPQGWAEYVAALAAQGVTEPLDFPSVEGGNTAFFVGAAEAHLFSTAKVRVQATWNEFDDTDATVRAIGTGEQKKFEYRSAPDRAEFAFEFPRGCEQLKPADIPSELNLLKDDTGTLRGLKIDFRNTKARHLTIGVHGVSRFTDFYKAPKHPDHAAQFERHDSKKDFSYWVDSTKRPEKPEIDRILPVFSGAITECRHGPHKKIREIIYRRHVSLRIFLKRGWFSSGEGELLGVICWPSNIFNGGTVEADMAKCTLLDRAAPRVINAKEEFLTRWGADPVRQSGDLSELIPPSAFDSAVVHQGPLKLPVQSPDKDVPGGTPSFEIDKGCPNDPPASNILSPSNSVDVAIAGYKPILEPNQGQLWYCDLPIDSSRAFDSQTSYFPFIRLGLARYQAHSTPGLELSYPVAEWAQIPPRRTVRVELLGSHDVLVVVQGHGYHSSNAEQLGLPAADIERLNHSAFRIRICRSSRPEAVPGLDNDGWLPVIMEGCALECRVTTESNEPAGPILVCRKFRLPHSWESRSYAVIVEEYEPMIADGAIYNEPVVVDRGPMFACTIPIAVHHPAPCKADADDNFLGRQQLLDALQDA
ncbi:hypothetical protein AB8A05_15400 [Tardiphaga sp. 538_B7_N1_4]|uniref:hypothetical protein n=1 Tax=Tardiphaga sp. 538_B7_N1_4 TaxID=3240778 RepID=UPI003F204122